MTKNVSFITDPHGRFYAGMTLAEAQVNGTDRSFWRRDFYNLDTNCNGILSVEEVMNERKRSSKIDKWTAGIFGIVGMFDILSDRSSKGWLALDLLLDGYIIISSLINAHKTDKGTERMENELLKNSNNKIDANA